MKYLILALLSTQVQAKEFFIYTCKIDKELKTEISLLDKNNPSVDLFYKNSKYASCLFENTPLSKPANPRAIITDAVWHLQLKDCRYYFEAHKERIKVDKDITFKQASGRGKSYLAVIENAHPLECLPKK